MAAYLKWPDARLRAYLREHGVSEDYIPGDRPSLLRTFATSHIEFLTYHRIVTEETRIRWIQSQNSAEALLSKIKGVVNSGVYKAEEALHRLYSLLVGGWEDGKSKGAACGDAAKTEWEEAKDAFETSTESAEDLVNKAKEKLDEKVKVGERKVKTEL